MDSECHLSFYEFLGWPLRVPLSASDRRGVRQERFAVGDQRRNALMQSARMLASRMEMDELFTAVMSHAKDLMEVDRSSLFMVDRNAGTLYTIVADGAAPIVIPKDKGLAGAALKLRKVVTVADAYLDARFNREFDIRSGYRTKQVAAPLDCLLMVS